MARFSDCFNKKSRLIRSPQLDSRQARQLAKNREDIEQRLSALLRVQNDFFPCFDWTFPPPLLSKSAAPSSAAELFSVPSVTPGRYAIYLHSPFCKSLCSFCYYAVIPERGSHMAEDYINHLVREMALYAEALQDQVCESVYFGGGTPTFLSDKLLRRVFEALQFYFNIEPGAEITIEASPGTLSEDKLTLLRTLGVNRLSYGIQTLNETLLAGMNRSYSVTTACDELRYAIDIIGNVNVDTMYGFDNEHEDDLLITLEKLHDLGVPSVSIYALDKQRSQSLQTLAPPKDSLYDNKIRQFSRAEAVLAAKGFKSVLQNVFLDPTRASYKHQVRRWDNLPLVALGMNSQGYAPQRPYQNIASMKSYCEAVDAGCLPVATSDTLDPALDLCREVTSKLRFTYLSLGHIQYKYGVDLYAVFGGLIEALLSMGYLEQQGDILRMTPKAAYYNNIIPMLFAPDAFKQALLGLPEEYIEAFPVPYIMTQLGGIQSAPFSFRAGNGDRRVESDRRRARVHDEVSVELRESVGRRSTDCLSSGAIALA